jgi:sugar/nucleoside kinase (ribokinase family)
MADDHELHYAWDPDHGRAGFAAALEVIEMARAHNCGRLSGVVSPMQIDTCTPELLRDSRDAARERGLPVVLDADRPTQMSDDLFRIATHVVFSSECLRATTGLDDLAVALARISDLTPSFLAVTQGAQDVLWRDGVTLRRSPVFAVQAVDTLGAGDVFHGGFALALAEGKDEIAAMRFAAAAAGLKCTRLGGSAGAPYRAEVETLLASPYPATASNP